MSRYRYLSEEALVKAVREGSDDALDQLYRQNYQRVLHLIINNNGSEEEAKDVYQEAVIVLFEKLSDPGFELTCKVQTYLYSVSRRLWLKQLEGKTRFTGLQEDWEETIPVEEFDLDESERKFRDMAESFSELGEPCKSLIEDFYIKKLSMKEISEKFGYTNADNAKTQKYKCLNRLKKIFFEKHKEILE